MLIRLSNGAEINPEQITAIVPQDIEGTFLVLLQKDTIEIDAQEHNDLSFVLNVKNLKDLRKEVEDAIKLQEKIEKQGVKKDIRYIGQKESP